MLQARLCRVAIKALEKILRRWYGPRPTKNKIVQAVVFLLILCGQENWTLKKQNRVFMLLNFGVGTWSENTMES